MSAVCVIVLVSSAIPSLVEPLVGAAAEVVEHRATSLRLGLGEQADVGLGELVAEVGDEVADGAEQAGRGRDEHRERAHQRATAFAWSGPAPP